LITGRLDGDDRAAKGVLDIGRRTGVILVRSSSSSE
jgi:hypothetical protein